MITYNYNIFFFYIQQNSHTLLNNNTMLYVNFQNKSCKNNLLQNLIEQKENFVRKLRRANEVFNFFIGFIQ